MAKYTITYKCGHEVEKQLYGKYSERESYIEWCKGQICPECLRAENHKKALADAEENGYPELVGSEKQISWAIDLRFAFVNAIRKQLETNREKIAMTHLEESVREEKLRQYDSKVPELMDVLNGCITDNTSAKYWIDNRYYIEPGREVWEDYGSPVELLAKYKTEKSQK